MCETWPQSRQSWESPVGRVRHFIPFSIASYSPLVGRRQTEQRGKRDPPPHIAQMVLASLSLCCTPCSHILMQPIETIVQQEQIGGRMRACVPRRSPAIALSNTVESMTVGRKAFSTAFSSSVRFSGSPHVRSISAYASTWHCNCVQRVCCKEALWIHQTHSQVAQ